MMRNMKKATIYKKLKNFRKKGEAMYKTDINILNNRC